MSPGNTVTGTAYSAEASGFTHFIASPGTDTANFNLVTGDLTASLQANATAVFHTDTSHLATISLANFTSFAGGTGTNTWQLTNNSGSSFIIDGTAASTNVLDASAVTSSAVIDLADGRYAIGMGSSLSTQIVVVNQLNQSSGTNIFGNVHAVITSSSGTTAVEFQATDSLGTTVFGGGGTALLYDASNTVTASHGTLIGANFQDVHIGSSNATDSFYAYAGTGNATAIGNPGPHEFSVLNIVDETGSSTHLATTVHMATSAQLSSITYAGYAGIDSFSGFKDIYGGDGTTSFYAGTDSVTYHGGSGDNVMYAGNAGTATIYDTFNLAGTANTLDFSQVASAVSINLAAYYATYSNATIDIANASQLNFVQGSNSGNLFDIGAFYGAYNGGPLTVYGGSGDDTFLMISDALSQVTIIGGGGNDTLALTTDGDYSQSDFNNVTNVTSLQLDGSGGGMTLTGWSGLSFAAIDLTREQSNAVIDLTASTNSLAVFVGDISDQTVYGNMLGNQVLSAAGVDDVLGMNVLEGSLWMTSGSDDSFFGFSAFQGNGGNSDLQLMDSVGAISINLTGVTAGGMDANSATVDGVTYSVSGFETVEVDADAITTGSTLIGYSNYSYLAVDDVGGRFSDTKLSHVSGFSYIDLAGITSDTTAHIALGTNAVKDGLQTVYIDGAPGADLDVNAKSLMTPISIVLDDTNIHSIHVGGGSGNDYIDISAVNANIANASGVNGGLGNDTIVVNQEENADGGGGNDTLVIPAAALFNFSTVSVVLGTSDGHYSPVITQINSSVPGGTQSFFQNFVLSGSIGGDPSIFASGRDQQSHTIITGSGDDTLVGGNSTNYLDAGTGTNILMGGNSNNTFIANANADDTIYASSSALNTIELADQVVAATYNLNNVGTNPLNGQGDYSFGTNGLTAQMWTGYYYSADFATTSFTDSLGDVIIGTLNSTDAASSVVVDVDLVVMGAGSHAISLNGHGGFIDILTYDGSNNTGNVSVDGGSLTDLVTVELSLNSTGTNVLTSSAASGQSLIVTGFETNPTATPLVLATAFSNLSYSAAYTNIDASGVYSPNGIGLDIGSAANTSGETIVGSHGGDILRGGTGNDTLVSTSGISTLIGGGGNDTFVIMPTAGTAHTDHISLNGSTGTVDLSNFGDVNVAITGFARGNNGDLIAYLSQAAGGGTIDIAGYYAQAHTLIGQDTVGNGGGTATFVLGTSVLTGTADLNNYILVGDATHTALTAQPSGANFYWGGGTETFSDTGGHGKADFSLYDTLTSTSSGLLVDLSGTTGSVYQLNSTDASSLHSTTGTLTLSNLTSASLHTFETSGHVGTTVATMAGMNHVNGSAGNDIFIGPASNSGGEGAQFQGNGGNDTYVDLQPGNGSVNVSYENAPMLSSKDSTGSVVFEGGVVVNLDNTAHSFGGGLGVTIAAGHALNGWGGTDTLIGITNVTGSANNDIIWGGTSGLDFAGGGGDNTMIGSANAINTIDYENDPGRVLGGSTGAIQELGVRVNLGSSDYNYTIGGLSLTVAANTGLNGYGGTDTLSNVINVVGSDYNDLLISNNSGGGTLTGGGGNNTLVGAGYGAYASYQNDAGVATIDLSAAPRSTPTNSATGRPYTAPTF